MTIQNHLCAIVPIFSITCLWLLNSCTPTPVGTHPSSGDIGSPSQSGHSNQSSKILYKATDHRPYILTNHRDHQSRRWLIDSGASHTILFAPQHPTTDRDIVITDSHSASNIHGLFNAKKYNLKQFQLKTEDTPSISGFILPRDSNYSDHKTEGIIGISTLTKNHVSLDIRQKKLRWNDRSHFLGKSHAVQLTRHPKTGHLILSTRYNSATSPALTFIIDTGASRSVISYQAARRLKLDFKSTTQKLSGFHHSPRGVSLIKNVPLITHEQQHIRIRNMFVADLPSIQQNLSHTETAPIDGILGYHFLKTHCHSINFGRGYLIFKE